MDSDRPPGDLREQRAPWDGKRVVLGVCGGIAAYKVIQVARDLTLLGSTVDVVLTEAASRFVTPLTFEGVTGRRPLQDLFSAEGAALHVRLAQEADAICVAPATADFLARSAGGRADDLLTTLLLATRAPVVVAPAMNDGMFAHPQTQANLKQLRDRGYLIVGPAQGRLAVGEGTGPGRMEEPQTVVEAVGRALEPPSPLSGRSVADHGRPYPRGPGSRPFSGEQELGEDGVRPGAGRVATGSPGDSGLRTHRPLSPCGRSLRARRIRRGHERRSPGPRGRRGRGGVRGRSGGLPPSGATSVEDEAGSVLGIRWRSVSS